MAKRSLSLIGFLGAVLAAFLASLCCVGPIILAAVGISTMGLMTAFEPYRPWLIGLALALLVLALYVVFRNRTCCEVDAQRTRLRRVLNIMGLALLLIVFSTIILMPWLLSLRRPDSAKGSTSQVVPIQKRAVDPCCLTGK